MAEALPIAWLNGRLLPIAEARISPLDRGFLFADAVYEMIPAYAGRPLLLDAHLARLGRSLAALQIPDPLDEAGWKQLLQSLIDANGGGDLAIYLQVSRGADTGRDHLPPAALEPTVFAMATRAPPPAGAIAAITASDERWAHCDIKSTGLLANVLARARAEAAGAREAILLRDGWLTEGASSSVIVVVGGTLLRRPGGPEVLPGTTTDLVVRLADEAGYRCRQEPVSEARLRAADEIWITSAMRGVAAVVRLDGEPVGSGEPGPVWQTVAAMYEDYKYGRR
ncbi:MAG: D-amino acid aminotransferase [Gammaproteobacteria bacterium]|nr:MAG: D-amino acid aminotransferase [Gammaproteobacteria bacterium]